MSRSPGQPRSGASQDIDHLLSLGAFLRAHRASATPAEVGFGSFNRRRVAGLRREEVAQLAGISAAWYTALEQGSEVHPSLETLRGIARALCLNASEQQHLFLLATAPRRPSSPAVGPGVPTSGVAAASGFPSQDNSTRATSRRLVEGYVDAPAILVDRYWDILARNAALDLVFPCLAEPVRSTEGPPDNLLRRVLTHPEWQDLIVNWRETGRALVGGLRATLTEQLVEHPLDARALTIPAELARVSTHFRQWWQEHSVWRAEKLLVQVLAHPALGHLELEATLLEVRSAPGLALLVLLPNHADTAATIARLAQPPRE